MATTVIDLIGHSVHGSLVQEYLQSLVSITSSSSDASFRGVISKTPTSTKSFPDVTFYNYVPLGLSIECTNDEQHTIEAVQCYAAKNNEKEFPYGFCGSLPDPFTMQLNNVQIVNMLGEPDKKGGGSIPIWISYESKSKLSQSMTCGSAQICVQIDFLFKEWEAVPNPVAHYTFWKK